MDQIRYQHSKIYKIVSDQTNRIYVGSTVNVLSKRLSEHKSMYKRYKNGSHHYVTSFDIVQYDDAKIILVESYPCNNKDELRARERYHIETLDCVNRCIPGRSAKEYRDEHRSDMIEYRIKHKEHLDTMMRKKSDCPCGGKFTYRSKQQHYKTRKHQKYLTLNIPVFDSNEPLPNETLPNETLPGDHLQENILGSDEIITMATSERPQSDQDAHNQELLPIQTIQSFSCVSKY